jgi:hypothetical protein
LDIIPCMAREIITVLLVLLLLYGAWVRYRLMAPGLSRLSGPDRLREWLGYLFFLGLCAGMIGLYWVSAKAVMAVLAFGVVLTYRISARKQFPIFRQ